MSELTAEHGKKLEPTTKFFETSNLGTWIVKEFKSNVHKTQSSPFIKENSSTFVELNTVNCLDGLLAELKQPVPPPPAPFGS